MTAVGVQQTRATKSSQLAGGFRNIRCVAVFKLRNPGRPFGRDSTVEKQVLSLHTKSVKYDNATFRPVVSSKLL